MNNRISKIIESTAEILYRRGLWNFNAELQQQLISSCTLGKIAELYENEELKKEAESTFLNAWFRGELSHNINLPQSAFVSNIKPPPSRYLIFLFFGIGMKEGDERMNNFADKLTRILKKRNPENEVFISKTASFDDTRDKTGINDGLIADSVQVVLRAYLPTGAPISRFASDIYKSCRKNPDSKVILIGYSGGGVVVTRICEELEKNNACIPDKIIRIGSPELTTGTENKEKTVNIIIPGDPVPLITFMRENASSRAESRFLLDMKYDTLNPVEIHGLYFSENQDESGVKNYEKTASACSEYIK